MGNMRRPIAIIALLLGAFIWGYRGDEVVTDVTRVWNSGAKDGATTSGAVVGPGSAAEGATGGAAAPGAPGSMGPQVAPYTGAIVPPGGNPTHPGQLYGPPPGAQPPASMPKQTAGRWIYPGPQSNTPGGQPVGPLPLPMASPAPGSGPAAPGQPNPAFAATMDSITPGSVQENQITQRNLYFEKLSQQLKELQGEQPPAALPPQDPGAAAAQPQSPPAGNPGAIQPENLIPGNPNLGVGAVVPNPENIAIDNPYSQMPNNSVQPADSGDQNGQYPTDPDAEDPEGDDTTDEAQ